MILAARLLLGLEGGVGGGCVYVCVCVCLGVYVYIWLRGG